MNRIMRLLQVTWTDLENTDGYNDVVTVGMLIESDGDHYIIASTYDPSTDFVNQATWIPKKNVKKIKPLGAVALRVS